MWSGKKGHERTRFCWCLSTGRRNDEWSCWLYFLLITHIMMSDAGHIVGMMPVGLEIYLQCCNAIFVSAYHQERLPLSVFFNTLHIKAEGMLYDHHHDENSVEMKTSFSSESVTRGMSSATDFHPYQRREQMKREEMSTILTVLICSTVWSLVTTG